MAAQAQLISNPLPLPPPPIALPPPPIALPTPPTPLPRTRGEGGSRPVDPSDKEGGGERLEGEG